MGEYDELLKELRQQEEDIQFVSFGNDTALAVGMALVQAAQDKGKAVTIDVTRSGQQLFHFAMAGTSIDNGEWVKRKNRVVNRFGHSSYYMGISLKNAGQTIEEKYLLPESDYAAHGGAFPLIIKGVGVVGTITVSGLPQQEDHELVVNTLKQFLGNGQIRKESM
ncbi:MAG TPA: heme-degrading domain-containing protein [Ktedonobacteraceae bacterium]|nr:heme-degrading domain-containing protein [Ktedonobacteraceae bacterium]